jgi:hypothetical protein
MKIPSILSLIIVASVPLAASAAAALPASSVSSSLREFVLAPIQIAQHRQHLRRHHRAAPAEESYGYSGDAYSPNGGEGVNDWSHWSPSHHPGWPCISGGSDGSQTSAYPAWEMKPQCQ